MGSCFGRRTDIEIRVHSGDFSEDEKRCPSGATASRSGGLPRRLESIEPKNCHRMLPQFLNHVVANESMIVACFNTSKGVEYISGSVFEILGYKDEDTYNVPPCFNAIYYRPHRNGSYVKFLNTFYSLSPTGELFTMDQIVPPDDKREVTTLIINVFGEVEVCEGEECISLHSSDLIGNTLKSHCHSSSHKAIDSACMSAIKGKSTFNLYVSASFEGRGMELALDFHHCVNNHVFVCASMSVSDTFTECYPNPETSLSGKSVLMDKRLRQLRSEIEYLKDFRDHALMPMYSVDAKGTILWANDAMIKLMGFESAKNEYIGSYGGKYHIDHANVDFIFEMILANKPVVNFPCSVKTRNGDILEVIYNSNCRFHDNGQFAYSRCVVQDVTERNKWMRERDEWHRKQLVAEKNEQAALEASQTKTQFLAVMSHELRTPLNGVLGAASLLEATSLSEEQSEYVSTITESADILLALIHNILDISKIERNQLQLDCVSFRVEDSVNKCSRILRSRVSAKGLQYIKTIVSPLDDPGRFHKGDPGRLNQVILNFLSNAVKFTEKGTIECRASVAEADDDTSTDELLLEVIDTGIGVAAEAQAKLFTDFVQVSPQTYHKYGGTGLGLSISRKLIEMMGGVVGMESVVGEGTVVWARFPLERETDAPVILSTINSARKSEVGNTRDVATIRVLFAEDVLVNQKLLRRMLEVIGFCDIVGCDNGLQAVNAVKDAWAQNRPFEIILMDCLMPVMDGLEATRQIRTFEATLQGKENFQPAKILALTANATNEDSQSCIASGMDAFYVKPLNRDKLNGLMMHWASMLS